MRARLQQSARSGDGVGARGTAAWPDHAPGMLLPFPGGGDPPSSWGLDLLPSHSGGMLQVGPISWGLACTPSPSPQDMSSSPVVSCMVPWSQARATTSYARLHLLSAASAKRGRWGTTRCGFTCVAPGRGSSRGPPWAGEQGSVPPHLPLPGLFPCSQGCSTAAAAAPLEAQQSLLPARACSQGQYIYI